jgi:hypothetical protein
VHVTDLKRKVLLEAISKPQMAFEGKAKADAQSRLSRRDEHFA